MKKIILVQHCQSEHHVNEMSGGWTDTPLTDLGRAQALAIAKRLKNDFNMEKYIVYSSDLKRAYQTAEIITNHLKMPLNVESTLREINTGIATGQTKQWAEAHRNPPIVGRDFLLNHREFPEGESWQEFYNRTSMCMQKLSRKAEEMDKNLLIVSHGGTIGYIISWWLYFDERMLTKTYIHASPASISVLDESTLFNQHAISKLNDTAHLSNLFSKN